MTRITKLSRALSIVVGIALGIYGYQWGDFLVKQTWKQLPAGSQAPTAVKDKLQQLDGSTFHYPEGQQVFLWFFSTTCPWSESELPMLAEFARTHSETTVIAVDYGNEASATIKEYVQSKDMPYAIVADPGGEMANRFGVLSTPSSFVIEPDGRIRHSRRGGGPGVTVEQFKLWTTLPIPASPVLGWLADLAR